MKIESESLRNALVEKQQGSISEQLEASLIDEILGIVENLEQQQIDAPMQTRALWTSLGHHAELTYQGKHWTLRAFPGGFSAKCNDTGAFHIGEAADLPSAMLAAEEFVLGEVDRDDIDAAGIVDEADAEADLGNTPTH